MSLGVRPIVQDGAQHLVLAHAGGPPSLIPMHHQSISEFPATNGARNDVPASRAAPCRKVYSYRRITPGEQLRLEVAARVEDTRSVLEAMTDAVAAPHIRRNPALPKALRSTLNDGIKAHARRVLKRVPFTTPPRLEMFLVLTLDTGMLIEEALEVTFSNIDEHSGKVTLARDRGNGTRYQVPAEYLKKLEVLKTFDTTRPVLRLSRDSLERSWSFMCEAAGLPNLTLSDLQFEAQSQLRMRQPA